MVVEVFIFYRYVENGIFQFIILVKEILDKYCVFFGMIRYKVDSVFGVLKDNKCSIVWVSQFFQGILDSVGGVFGIILC